MLHIETNFQAQLDAVRSVMAEPPLTRARKADVERARRAADQVLASGGTALDAACKAIQVGFDVIATYRTRKAMAETFIKLGAGHVEIRGRFGNFARTVQARKLSLNEAIILAEQGDHPLRAEGRILLRWLRRRWPQCPWTTFVAMVAEPLWFPVVFPEDRQ